MLNLFLIQVGPTVAKSKKLILFQELFKNQLKLYFETSSSCVQTKSEICGFRPKPHAYNRN